MTKQELLDRIDELKRHQQYLADQINATIGGIQELTRLVELLDQPPQPEGGA